MAGISHMVGIPGACLWQGSGCSAAAVHVARLFSLWHPRQEDTVTTDACLSKVWTGVRARSQLCRHNSEQGIVPACTSYRGASRKVTLGERGASTHHKILRCASPLAEPRIPRALAVGV